MKVCDIMTKSPIYVGPDTSVTDAKALMNKEKINVSYCLDNYRYVINYMSKADS